MYDQPIDRILNKNAATLEVTAGLDEAKRILQEQQLDALPILSGTRLVGVLSARDLLDSDVERVADAMRVNFEVVHGDATLRDVFNLITQSGVQVIPAVTADHDYLGVVNAVDLIREVYDARATQGEGQGKSTLVEVRSADIPQPADGEYHRALLAAYSLYTSQDPNGIGQALLYSDRHRLLLHKAFDIARRYVFAGQDLQELTRLRRAIEDVRDFEEKTGQSRRIPGGRM